MLQWVTSKKRSDRTDYLIGKLPDETEVQIRTRPNQTLKPN